MPNNKKNPISGNKFTDTIDKLISEVAHDNSHEAPENLLLMVSNETMPVLLPDACGLFSDWNNPFYNGSEDREWLGEKSPTLLTRGVIPDDVAEYIQHKKLLSHAFIYASGEKDWQTYCAG